ncbi:hypothetical protein HLH34_18780 [Gluconacetobacter azotocaptans]|uniref:DUF6602 domain-containing protein n=1 Tax=Gluconacetobacter azotocaptans TaxID=142834 RepID=A0A7W4JW59_9PROT|nr:DUF6602 domain-containing protein [Gluconacetobacter azotocaptans]MBB2191979.1 hypothetical protein [Gluconacetobacter azotocaptans]GBQ31946.1 hypothetical protein AA13594_2233 [Gluconacetobacter azotocaptans DSM 13594]
MTPSIDLPAIFDVAAEKMLLSIKEGRQSHATGNIRESGSELETEFRQFLSDRIPNLYGVKSGYLFDASMSCTPQIDAFITNNELTHALKVTSEDSVYVPYTCAHMIFEIKNSSSGIKSYLDQIGNISRAIIGMRKKYVEKYFEPGSNLYHKPLSFLFLGDTENGKLRDIQEWYSNNDIKPDYIILLDRSLIIAAQSQFFTMDHLSFYDYRSGDEYCIFEPKSSICKKGHMLMWIYFCIISNLNLILHGNNNQIIEFTKIVENDYPMKKKAVLSSATSW